MPRGTEPGRPPAGTRRQLMDGMRWRTRTGAPWRDVPERHGPRDRGHDLFRRRQRDGTWARVVTQLQAEADVKGLITWDGLRPQSSDARLRRRSAGEVRQDRLPRAPCRRVRNPSSRAPPVPSPRGTTSPPSATRRPCWSRSSTSGCDQHLPDRT
ncbi:transposase [Streptomyces sp. MH13]|uniref:transposase n=1 Tax=Streptomyces sp. MH13 TaxID=3417651 RepID=UPI003CF02AE4